MAPGSRQIWRDWIIIAVAAVTGLIWAIHSDLFWRQDLGVYDALIAHTAPPASDDIVIVAIDDESILKLGRFPWDRDLHARVLDQLTRAGARTVLYDVLFLEPGKGDEVLARSVREAGPILPLAMEFPGRDGDEVTVVEPLPSLHGPRVSIGHAEILPDKDGIIRSVHLLEDVHGRQWPHVAAIAACRVAKSACIRPMSANEGRRIGKQTFLIPFTESGPAFRSVSFISVLDGGVPDEFFKDRTVLVGATAIGLNDVYATPLSPSRALMPGVEVNANIVQALLSGHRIAPAPMWLRLAMTFVPLGLLLITLLVARPLTIFLAALVLALLVAGTTLLFWRNGIWLSPVAGLVGIGVTYPVWAARRLQVATTFMREELKRFRRDEDIRDSAQFPSAPLPAADMVQLHNAISRSRDFQNFLRDILNGLPDASFVMGQDGIILIQNAEAQMLLGGVEEDHFSVILKRLSIRHQEDRSMLPEASAFPEELTDSGGRIFNVRWSRIRDQGGDDIAWVLRLAEITDLRQATRQREEALQLLTHDMRSPQISILALLSRQQAAGTDELLQRIKYYAGRTLALADGYVQLARAESARLSIEEISLADIVFDAVDDLWPQANNQNITLKTENCDQDVVVQGDRQLLTRVVMNIIDNAIKHSFPGAAVECGIEVAGSHAVISICDRGPGVEAEAVGRLFDRFQQGVKGGPNGAGLGLAFARSVAERHFGTITYSARAGGGACFNLTLPLAQEAALSSADR